jgi:hypothetical protein
MINYKFTNNGAIGYDSTGIALLDMFATAGSLRGSSLVNLKDQFRKAYNENPLLAMRFVFYCRDPRGGYGERETGRALMSAAADVAPESFIKNLPLVPYFGRFDDLASLFDHPNQKVSMIAIKLFARQLRDDVHATKPSIAAKWAPSENASSKTRRKHALKLIDEMEITPRQYRKLLSNLRARLQIVETPITEREYSTINYSKIPSLAHKKYVKAFGRNDEQRYSEYITKVFNGEEKINTSVLFPYDVMQAGAFAYSGYDGYTLRNYTQTVQVMWDNLPNYMPEIEQNILVVADTSTSMTSDRLLPIMNSLALAIYISERSSGFWKDKVLGFSSSPSWYDLSKAKTLKDKIGQLTAVDGSTNLEAALGAILSSIQMFNAPQLDKIIIPTDMHFNDSVTGRRTLETLMEQAKAKFVAAGVKFPEVTFWNLNAANPVFQTTNVPGFTYVSGYSPAVLKQVLSGKYLTPYEVMVQTLSQDRYLPITV